MNIQELKLKSSEQLITQAEDGIRDLHLSRGLGDVYKRQPLVSDVFKVMEKKLFFYIMTPAMTLSWIFGLVLIHEIGFEQLVQKWMILKLVFVTILTLYHFYLGRILEQFKLDMNKHSHKYYRYINEIPTLFLILIIFVVIFKPI